MDLDDQLRRYFGANDIATLPPDALAAGTERMLVDFGLTRDRNERFALWTLMFVLGVAPDLDAAFPRAEDRDAARNIMDLMARPREDRTGEDQAGAE